MQALEQLRFVVSLVTAGCVSLVLAAVALSFVLLSRGGARDVRRSPVATLSMLGFLAGFYLLMHWRISEADWLGYGWRLALALAGCALLALGTAVNLAGRLNLKRNWADQATVYEDQQLVTSGVYGWLRHPLYASLIWMYCGAALAYANPAALAADLLVFVPAMYWRARLEERLLVLHLPGYAEYMKRTPMFVPKLWIR